jgi:predicted enzyme related to lactoylglutathione lyase
MTNHVAHFAIPADDVERAKRFYERVFKWRIEAWGPPDFYVIFTEGAEKPTGSIGKRDDLVAARRDSSLPKSGGIGWECTVAVDDLAPIKAAIIKNGGRIVHDEYEIVGVGTLIRFADTEGNIACAMKYVN